MNTAFNVEAGIRSAELTAEACRFPDAAGRRIYMILAFILAAVAVQGRGDPLAGIQEVMGPLPRIDHNAPLSVQTLETTPLEHYVRRKITFVPEPGFLVHAWLLIPDGAHRAPAVLCLHQTTDIGKDEPAGLGGKPNLHYAQELALRGYVALAPDYPSFGEDKTRSYFQSGIYSHGYQSTTMKGIVNHIRAVDLLVSLPEVDPNRIGVIGHSLGGHNSLFVAAFDPRLRAVVTSCGFTAMSRSRGGNLKGWSQDVYMPLVAIRYHSSARELPFDFPDILDAIAPRAVFVNAPVHDSNFDIVGVDECIAKVRSRFPGRRLVVAHPDCQHDFPPEIREQAYRFLDEQLQ